MMATDMKTNNTIHRAKPLVYKKKNIVRKKKNHYSLCSKQHPEQQII